MANQQQLAILDQGSTAWNRWREQNPDVDIDLSQAILIKKNLVRVNLDNACLIGANFQGAELYGASFRGADLTQSSLLEAKLSNADFTKANLMEAQLGGALLEKACLQKASFLKASLYDSVLREANLSESILRWANLENASLFSAVICKANLYGANLTEAKLSQADLSYSNLDEADLSKANLNKACLVSARLSEAKLRSAFLYEAILVKVNLSRADLTEANLSRADLTEADLQLAIMNGTNLACATLDRASVTYAIVDGATLIAGCQVDDGTDFSGVGLDSARIEDELKAQLRQNIRKRHWNRRYKASPLLNLARPFWWASDYGSSTSRLIFSFVVTSLVFSLIYLSAEIPAPSWGFWPTNESPMLKGLVDSDNPYPNNDFKWFILWGRAIYFSVVTMTTLGFGDISAHPLNVWGHSNSHFGFQVELAPSESMKSNNASQLANQK